MKKWIKQEKYFFFMSPAITWQILFFILPLFFVLQLSVFTNLFQGLTFSYFQQVIHWPHFFVIFRSLWLATRTATLCLMIGYPVAYFIALHPSQRVRSFLLFLLTLPFMINILIQVYAWYFLLERHGIVNKAIGMVGIQPGNYLNSSFAINIVMFHIFLPFMIMPLFSILEKINIRLIEASLDLGASLSQTFFRVILPLSLPGIKIGFFLVYVTSFGEYAIPSLLGGQKNFFVGTLISEYFFIGKDWHGGAAFTCLSCFVFILSVFIYHRLISYIVYRLQRV